MNKSEVEVWHDYFRANLQDYDAPHAAEEADSALRVFKARFTQNSSGGPWVAKPTVAQLIEEGCAGERA